MKFGCVCVVLSGLVGIGCASTSDDGTQVRLISTPLTLRAGEEVQTQGGPLRVDALQWTATEVELTPCRSAWRRATEWLLPTANAHGASGPTLMAAPTVLDAASADDVVLGELEPPAASYCGLRHRIAPADGDAQGLDESPDMLGRSFFFGGAIASTAGELEPFEQRSALAFDVQRQLQLELSPDHQSAVIHLRHDVAGAFAELDLRGLSPSDRERALLVAFQASLTVQVE